MNAINLQFPGQISVQQRDLPQRKEGQALIKIKAAGICGSDIGAFRGTNPLVSYPRIIGHELVGEVVEIDSNKHNLTVGSRVVIDPYLYCNKCYPCSLGRTNCCESLKVLGVHVDGGFSEYFLHPADMLVPIPDGMPWTDAALSEPLTIALHAVHRTNLKAGMHMAINGAGAIGILAALSAMAYGAEPILIDLVEERLAFARTLGVKKTINLTNQDLLATLSEYTNGRMAEVVLEASGANQAVRNTLDMASFAGTIGLTGWPKEPTLLPTDVITKKELNICGCRTSAGEFEEALNLIHTGRVNARAILSKVVSLYEVPDIIRELSEHPGNYLKVVASF
jgi:L-gulonate 5-dehydrogenase